MFLKLLQKSLLKIDTLKKKQILSKMLLVKKEYYLKIRYSFL